MFRNGTAGSHVAVEHLRNDAFDEHRRTPRWIPKRELRRLSCQPRYSGARLGFPVGTLLVRRSIVRPIRGPTVERQPHRRSRRPKSLRLRQQLARRPRTRGDARAAHEAVADSGFLEMFQHAVNPANQSATGNYGMAIAQGLGWAMAAESPAAVGAPEAAACRWAVRPELPYLGNNAVMSRRRLAKRNRSDPRV